MEFRAEDAKIKGPLAQVQAIKLRHLALKA